MSTLARPRGPLPARVYWTRRLVVLGVPLLLVVLLARVLGGGSDGEDAAATVAVDVPVVEPSEPAVDDERATRRAARAAAEESRRGERRAEKAPKPKPDGPCDPSDVLVEPQVDTVVGGRTVPLAVAVRSIRDEACWFRFSADTVTLTITSGDDLIWASRQCPGAVPDRAVAVRQDPGRPVAVVRWSGRRSDDECGRATAWAMPGFYHAVAAALGGEATDVQFELVPPRPEVVEVTPSAEPSGAVEPDATR